MGEDRATALLRAAAAASLLALEVVAAAGVREAALASPFLLGVGASAALGPLWPVLALALFAGSYAGQTAVTGYVDSVVVLVVWAVLLVLCGRRSAAPAALLGALIGAAPVMVFALSQDDPDAARIGPATLALWALPLLAGRALRARQRHHDVALALVRAQGERTAADERARRAEERAALARDVHDLLGHALTSVVVQSRAAAAALPDDPEAVRAGLAAVDDVGTRALGELRAVVATLHDGTGAPGAAEPGLERLPDLVERMPLRAELHLVGDLGAADDVHRCVYRVVQECLTNTVRHSAADAVDVVVARDGGSLVVRVVDPGPVRPGGLPGGGRGLEGLRERVRALGGDVVAGPREAGFAVEARLPVAAP